MIRQRQPKGHANSVASSLLLLSSTKILAAQARGSHVPRPAARTRTRRRRARAERLARAEMPAGIFSQTRRRRPGQVYVYVTAAAAETNGQDEPVAGRGCSAGQLAGIRRSGAGSDSERARPWLWLYGLRGDGADRRQRVRRIGERRIRCVWTTWPGPGD